MVGGGRERGLFVFLLFLLLAHVLVAVAAKVKSRAV